MIGRATLRRWSVRTAAVLLATVGFVMAAADRADAQQAAPAQAKSPPRAAEDATTGSAGTSYVTPYPENDTYRIQVFGDAFAEGLLGGLVEALAPDGRLQVTRKHRTFSGIARQEFDEEIRGEEANRETMHIAVVMLGMADRNPIRLAGNKRISFGSEEWAVEYGRRIDRVIRMLKTRGAAIYWVGLPIVRRGDASEDIQQINEVIRERAFQNGVRYVDVYAGFQDEGGGYNQFGPDLNGKLQKMRDGDGVLFTQAGNAKLAHFVERDLKRDITQAKTDRAIPLAGSEAEQKKLSPNKGPVAVVAPAGWKGSVTRDPQAAAGAPGQPPAGAAADAGSDRKSDTSRISFKSMVGGKEEAVTMEIVRPALSGAVIALLTRRESSDRSAQLGETISDEVGPQILLNTIGTASGDATGAGNARRRATPANAPHYLVLVKGERVTAKPGRADDFSWPKPEPPPLVVPAAAPPRAPAAKAAPEPARKGSKANPRG